MSDEEEVVYVKRQKTIHYGSLEETMMKQLRSEGAEISNSGNERKITDIVPEYFDIDAEV
jgi:U4/U6 small nuclear ribonucleoprotein PRP4